MFLKIKFDSPLMSHKVVVLLCLKHSLGLNVSKDVKRFLIAYLEETCSGRWLATVNGTESAAAVCTFRCWVRAWTPDRHTGRSVLLKARLYSTADSVILLMSIIRSGVAWLAAARDAVTSPDCRGPLGLLLLNLVASSPAACYVHGNADVYVTGVGHGDLLLITAICVIAINCVLT